MAETSGLLNRRTGNSRTEGSNPSVSASSAAACAFAANSRKSLIPTALIHIREINRARGGSFLRQFPRRWGGCKESRTWHKTGIATGTVTVGGSSRTARAAGSSRTATEIGRVAAIAAATADDYLE